MVENTRDLSNFSLLYVTIILQFYNYPKAEKALRKKASKFLKTQIRSPSLINVNYSKN